MVYFLGSPQYYDGDIEGDMEILEGDIEEPYITEVAYFFSM